MIVHFLVRFTLRAVARVDPFSSSDPCEFVRVDNNANHLNLPLLYLYVVGVFLSFTLSQAGMVRH